MKKALFAVSTLGLGHATRTLPIIKRYAQEMKITLIAYGNALKFLKEELADFNVDYLEVEDYPELERGEGIAFYGYLIWDLFQTTRRIKAEHALVQTIAHRYDFIFSDGRYGVYAPGVPSFLLSHQISFMPPKGLKPFQALSDRSNRKYFQNFDQVFIPDYPSDTDNLSGTLSHTPWNDRFSHEFVGILSSYEAMSTPHDIDYLFIISGYLKAHKANFISNLLEQAKKLEGKKVFILGNAEAHTVDVMDAYDITVYSSATKTLRNELFNRSKAIVSRMGYTTVMDLVELEKKAILFPTPNSTEQEYLAEYHRHRDNFVICTDEKGFDLIRLTEALKQTSPYLGSWKTQTSLDRITRLIARYTK